MTDLESIKDEEQLKEVDENTAIMYYVTSKQIDIKNLKQEKERIIQDLAKGVPSDKELVEAGKLIHPFYTNGNQARLDEINAILDSIELKK